MKSKSKKTVKTEVSAKPQAKPLAKSAPKKTTAECAAKTSAKCAVKTPAKCAAKAPAKCAAKKAAPKNQRVVFCVRAEPGSKVFLAGSFNNWNPTAKKMVDKKADGTFVVALQLPPGEYQYKFVIDGTWCADPECPDWVQNDHGTLNSVKRVD
ncbi:MAG: glycogen-binding domain-containing protein [Kiritimatiellae bacterium]|jgi:1,4-alpha-glucan branching enzyme|nr:glycogen-binding domain-containing protein [Kiritimatiellia bacterium]